MVEDPPARHQELPKRSTRRRSRSLRFQPRADHQEKDIFQKAATIRRRINFLSRMDRAARTAIFGGYRTRMELEDRILGVICSFKVERTNRRLVRSHPLTVRNSIPCS